MREQEIIVLFTSAMLEKMTMVDVDIENVYRDHVLKTAEIQMFKYTKNSRAKCRVV